MVSSAPHDDARPTVRFQNMIVSMKLLLLLLPFTPTEPLCGVGVIIPSSTPGKSCSCESRWGASSCCCFRGAKRNVTGWLDREEREEERDRFSRRMVV
jgi:hypothetical protein